MIELIFATNNAHKVEEMQAIIPASLKVISLKQAGINIDIPEPFDTLEENAKEKSYVINKMTGMNTFSEDTGLEVEALNGEPGVRSARYAGEEKSFERNIEKLLANLKGNKNRKARFRAVISLIWEGKEYSFEGVSNGVICESPKGSKGFGYDPIFQPLGSVKTFGEMDLEEKTQYSHRKKAGDKLVLFLHNQLAPTT